MNVVSRLTLLALPLLAFLSSPARAQEVEVGTGLVCDTREQVERFVALYDGDPQSTANSVNAAFVQHCLWCKHVCHRPALLLVPDPLKPAYCQTSF